MASSTVSNRCVANKECKKNGIIKCDGCSSRFCSDHFPIHRQQLETRLELLCSERDQFHHEFIQSSQDLTELLTQIDRWEKQTLTHVKKTASNARDRVRQLAATKSSNQELEQFSEELRRRKESENYFEHDIERLAEQLRQIKTESKILLKIDTYM
jgi:antirestriction protein